MNARVVKRRETTPSARNMACAGVRNSDWLAFRVVRASFPPVDCTWLYYSFPSSCRSIASPTPSPTKRRCGPMVRLPCDVSVIFQDDRSLGCPSRVLSRVVSLCLSLSRRRRRAADSGARGDETDRDRPLDGVNSPGRNDALFAAQGNGGDEGRAAAGRNGHVLSPSKLRSTYLPPY